MTCCPATIQNFSNQATTTVSYSSDLKSKHGDIPKVQIVYYNEETQDFDLSIHATEVKLEGTPVNAIYVDHGGIMSGMIKIS